MQRSRTPTSTSSTTSRGPVPVLAVPAVLVVTGGRHFTGFADTVNCSPVAASPGCVAAAHPWWSLVRCFAVTGRRRPSADRDRSLAVGCCPTPRPWWSLWHLGVLDREPGAVAAHPVAAPAAHLALWCAVRIDRNAPDPDGGPHRVRRSRRRSHGTRSGCRGWTVGPRRRPQQRCPTDQPWRSPVLIVAWVLYRNRASVPPPPVSAVVGGSAVVCAFDVGLKPAAGRGRSALLLRGTAAARRLVRRG